MAARGMWRRCSWRGARGSRTCPWQTPRRRRWWQGSLPMDSTHVIALIAANLMVRNAVIASLGDPIDEAKDLIRSVMSDEPKLPEAPNTMARRGLPPDV